MKNNPRSTSTVHVCRSCGRYDTRNRDQVCGMCTRLTPTAYRNSDDVRRETRAINPDGSQRRSLPGPALEDGDVE